MDLFQQQMGSYFVPGVPQPPLETYEQMMAHVAPRPAWERYHRSPTAVDRLLNVQPGGVERMRQVDPNWSVDLLAFTPGATAGTNAAKIDTTLAGMQTQPQQQNSGGVGLNPLDAGMMAADLAANTLPLTQGPVAAPDAAQAAVQRTAVGRGIVADPWGAPTVPPRPAAPPAPGPAVRMIDELPTGMGPTPLHRTAPAAAPTGVSLSLETPAIAPAPAAGPALSVGSIPNVSGGGPGTSTAKGNATIARQAAKRAGGGKGLLAAADAALGAVDLGIGEASSRGLRSAGVMARNAGMKNLGRGLMRAGGAARVLAPAAAIGGAALPAVFGAMDGYEQAGAGGAVIQGGAGAAGALAGGAIGTAILPGVGTVIGAGIGSMLGSGAGGGLTGLAQGAVGKYHEGDTGFIGDLGRMLDPIIDTAEEKQERELLRQINSPAMRAIRRQEETRRMEQDTAAKQQLLLQAALRGQV